MRLILASESPRRAELLGRLGTPFEVLPARVDENCHGDAAGQAGELALRKARAVLAKVSGDCAVLGADTLVEVSGEILSKPRDHADARRMLGLLSGRWHQVHTGVALLGRRGERVFRHEQTVSSKVRFVPLEEADILVCLSGGEAMDKAGAYGIQGIAGGYIDRVEGDFYAIMGLPLCQVRRMLGELAVEMEALGLD